MRATWSLPLAAILVLAALLEWRREERLQQHDFLVYGELGRGAAIIIPADATPAEREGAELLARTLAATARSSSERFPIIRETLWWRSRRAIYLGATKQSAAQPALSRRTAIERPLAFSVNPNEVIIWAAEREDAGMAASLFLERMLGARWFMPGQDGLEVAPRATLKLVATWHSEIGRYYSRELGGVASAAIGREWVLANRLSALFPHGHTASELVPPALIKRRPQFAPLLNGARFLPEPDAPINWQPDLLADGLVAHVAGELERKFRENPSVWGAAFGLNDTYRFDQGERTLKVVLPERFFRTRPDYSDLLFQFLNRVAQPLAVRFPGRFVTTYAYDWTENTPRFRVAENIMPFLTADRSMWFDAGFAANDRALIERWGKLGPKFFGLYDYYYGAPFLVPRPTLWAVTEAIPYAYEKGARAFFAEATPNWGLDGPKPWLAAQLLWNPRDDSARLLAEYYRRFWKEAAVPMRAFFELCDQQWREQPKPPVWVKYLKDDDQRRLFPPEVRRVLQRCLEEAAATAKTNTVRKRVTFVAEAFAVTEAFCKHDETREELQRLLLDPKTSTSALSLAGERYASARADFVGKYQQLRRRSPLAIQTASIDDYLRHDPRRRLVSEVARRKETFSLSPPWLATLFEGRAPSTVALQGAGRELLADPELRTLSIKQVHPFTLTDWVERGPWGGKTEPTERRKIELLRDSDGTQRLRYSGCNQESLWQWRTVQPGHLYRATARIKGRVNPGTMVYLLVPFVDRKGQHLGPGHIDRLPVGNWPDAVELEVLVRAPANATQAAFSLRTLYQVPGDWTEWEALSLRDLGP
ncbi:DUF4838 domain-containing protein [Oleiharenicola sp. Vm1]|uniref:DUF4838 domain-containing protein n=1 Tax=Oleiharenicola sp. Vm1 TaxID=3398393 RepID=UPI0039F5A999